MGRKSLQLCLHVFSEHKKTMPPACHLSHSVILCEETEHSLGQPLWQCHRQLCTEGTWCPGAVSAPEGAVSQQQRWFGHQTLSTRQRGQTRPGQETQVVRKAGASVCQSGRKECQAGLKWGSHWPGRLQPSAALRVETIVLHYQNALVLV